MIKANLSNGSTTVEKENLLLTEHLSAHTGHIMPKTVHDVVVFCSRLMFWVPPGSDSLVSIELLGYVVLCPGETCRTTFHN